MNSICIALGHLFWLISLHEGPGKLNLQKHLWHKKMRPSKVESCLEVDA